MSLLARWGMRHAPSLPPGLIFGRVTRAASGLFRLITEDGPRDAELSGRLEYAAETAMDLPVTGDWVQATDTEPALILDVVPRTNCFTRATADGLQPLGANIDVGLLVMGLDGDYNPRRLERYLVLCREHGVRPAIVLNKRDLCAEAGSRVDAVRRLAPGAAVLALAALHDDVPAALGAILTPPQTVVLLGSSGAGKSTLLNRLCGQPLQSTAAVREDDSRGRHTTTSRELFLTPQGFLIADIPGLRAVGVAAEETALAEAFPEVAAASCDCRFRDCTHAGEPGCAVAVRVAPERLAAFHKLAREAAYEIRRNDMAAARAEKEKWKQIHRQMRRFQKPR
jgi:ribosome biogenesis GTPase / thiamine phosphate phosphatase